MQPMPSPFHYRWQAFAFGWYVIISVFYTTLHAFWHIRKLVHKLGEMADLARRERRANAQRARTVARTGETHEGTT